jgi:putative peptidoglycan lipid II flippase
MIVSQLILVFGSLATSVLQSFKYFVIPALAPVFYNLGMIAGIMFFSNTYGIYGPAIGVMLGAVLHFGIQLPTISLTGFKYLFTINLSDRGLKKVYSLVPPRILSVLMANLVGTINNSLAILISAPSVVFLRFAVQLQTLPVNLFGLSIASASLPTLSEESDRDQLKQFKRTFLTSFHQMMYFVIPFSVILLVLRIPVVRIVYGVSNFPWEATVKTAYVLAFFSLSIFAQSSNYLTTRAFYALKDTVTPVKVSLFTIFLNVLLSLFFVLYLGLGVWAVALSFTITSFIDMSLLLYLLDKKVDGFDLKKLIIPFTKISYAAVMMGITLYVPLKLLDRVVFDTTRTLNLLILTGIAGVSGMATYLFLTWLFKVEEIQLIYKLAKKIRLRKPEKVSLLDSNTKN